MKKKIFKGGINLKGIMHQTDTPPLELLPAPSTVTIPLVQHSGSPAYPMVQRGDHVSMGQMIGEARDVDAAAVHASISGTVANIVRYPFSPNRNAFSVVIENDGNDEFASPIPFDTPWMESEISGIIRKLSLSGVLDFSGNGIPVHVKLAAAGTRPLGTLIISALAAEPPVSSGLRLLLEQPERVLAGIAICKKITRASECVIAIDANRSDIEQALSERIASDPFKDIFICKLKPKYPLDREQLLVRACTGAEYAASMPYSRRDALVLTAETAACVRDAIVECRPWYERIVTVAGDPPAAPKNFLVRIGTPARLVLEAYGVNLTNINKVVFGGPLSGAAIQDLSAPVLKSTGCIVALEQPVPWIQQGPCIGCGRCVSVCPMRLWPSRLAACVRSGDTAGAAALSALECIECGCCAYACPAKINLVHYIALGKLRCGMRKIHGETPMEAIA